MRKSESTRSKKNVKPVPAVGYAVINSTFNNTIISVTKTDGKVLVQKSGGNKQKHAKKSTPYAAEEAGKEAGAVMIERGMKEIHVSLKGSGMGRESAVRGLSSAGLKILTITEKTPIAHNGVRRRKKKRN